MAESQDSVYDLVVQISRVYLGPPAERFIARQVENHLHKVPNDLTWEDVLNLIDWISAVVALLTEDSGVREEYIGELRKAAKNNLKPGHKPKDIL